MALPTENRKLPQKNKRNVNYKGLYDAFFAVKRGEMGIRTAARKYGCKPTTLRNRLSQRVSLGIVHPGPAPILNEEEEMKLAEFINKFSAYGYGFSCQDILDIGTDYAVGLKKRTVDEPLKRRWCQKFIERHPQLNLGKSKSFDKNQAETSSKEIVTLFFDNLEETLITYNLKEKPHQIFNVNEKGLTHNHKDKDVLYTRWTNTHKTSLPKGPLTTLIGCGNAIGNFLPPYFVFTGDKLKTSFLEDSNPGTAGTISTNGWSNTSIFLQYLKDHFLKYVEPTEEEPVVLLFDGHKSHVNLGVIDWARQENIILFVLPAATSHFLHPLEVGCFGLFDNLFTNSKDQLLRDNVKGQLSETEICRLACQAYLESLTIENIIDGFKRTGIQPLTGIRAIDSNLLTPPTQPIPVTEIQPEQDDDKQTQKAASPVRTDKLECGRCGLVYFDLQDFIQHRERELRQEMLFANNENLLNTKAVPSPTKWARRNKVCDKELTKSLIIKKQFEEWTDQQKRSQEQFNPEIHCCVCRAEVPPITTNDNNIEWLQCEKCDHWVHIGVCSPIDEHSNDDFICDCNHWPTTEKEKFIIS